MLATAIVTAPAAVAARKAPMVKGVVPLAATPMTTSLAPIFASDHGLRAGGLVVLGSFGAADQRVEASRHGKHKTILRPVISWRQLCAVLHADASGRAGSGVDDPAAALQRGHCILDSCGDRAKRGTNRAGGLKLGLIHGRDHLTRRPGIEFDVAWVDLLGAHGPVSVMS